MAKDIEIGIASETKAFKQGVEAGIIDPVEDAVKSLDELGESRGPEKLEDSLRDAQRATERLGDEVERTARDIEDDFKRTYRRVGDDADRGMDRAKDAAAEFKEEAISNFSEVTSSFDGSLESIADLAQGTFGGVALGLSGINLPAAIAVGSVGAAGGAVLQTLANVAEQTEQVVQDAFDDMRENQQRFVSDQFILDRVTEILNDSTKLGYIEKWADMLEDYGITVEDITLAIAGSREEQTKLNVALGEYEDAINGITINNRSAVNVQQDARTQIENLRGELELTNGALDTATGKYDLYAGAAARLADENHDAQEAIAATKQGLDNLPANVTTKVDVDTDDAERKLENLGRARTVRVTVEGVTRDGEKVF